MGRVKGNEMKTILMCSLLLSMTACNSDYSQAINPAEWNKASELCASNNGIKEVRGWQNTKGMGYYISFSCLNGAVFEGVKVEEK